MENDDLEPLLIRHVLRFLLFLIGLALLASGGFASITHNNGPGAATSLICGLLLIIIGGSGQWPSEVFWGENRIRLNRVVKKLKSEAEIIDQRTPELAESVLQLIDNQIQHESNKNNKLLLTKLKSELEKIESFNSKGNYDKKIERALSSSFVDIKLKDKFKDSKIKWDFELYQDDERVLVIETKYLEAPLTTFMGDSLKNLNEIPSQIPLLVVTNVEKIAPGKRRLLESRSRDNSNVICWKSESDNRVLLDAIENLTKVSKLRRKTN